jgi:hypothetical protein
VPEPPLPLKGTARARATLSTPGTARIRSRIAWKNAAICAGSV